MILTRQIMSVLQQSSLRPSINIIIKPLNNFIINYPVVPFVLYPNPAVIYDNQADLNPDPAVIYDNQADFPS
jgi:hypothetical protein